MITTRWLDEAQTYDGRQLRAHWILRETGIVGDAIVAFRGPCAVRDDEMADLEDLLAGASIAGDDMVHFVWESFDDRGPLVAVHRQRMLSAQAFELVGAMAPERVATARRDGDDLYVGERKLSISIATLTPVSSMIHFALNCVPRGTPVPTVGLVELGIEPRAFAERLLSIAIEEQDSIRRARAQVRAKGESS